MALTKGDKHPIKVMRKEKLDLNPVNITQIDDLEERIKRITKANSGSLCGFGGYLTLARSNIDLRKAH